jgi:hypothetical protein
MRMLWRLITILSTPEIADSYFQLRVRSPLAHQRPAQNPAIALYFAHRGLILLHRAHTAALAIFPRGRSIHRSVRSALPDRNAVKWRHGHTASRSNHGADICSCAVVASAIARWPRKKVAHTYLLTRSSGKSNSLIQVAGEILLYS